jgi:hypothetical protein
LEGIKLSTLAELSVIDAASKALETIIYGWYTDALVGSKWTDPYTGTFEDYAAEYLGNRYDDKYEIVGDTFDTASTWQAVKYEGSKSTRDEWTAELVAEYGGEGQGDQYWVVISVSDGITTRYFRRDGWYSSYNGSELDGDTYEVVPKEKTIVIYE